MLRSRLKCPEAFVAAGGRRHGCDHAWRLKGFVRRIVQVEWYLVSIETARQRVVAVLFRGDDLRRRPLRKPADRKWERGGGRLWTRGSSGKQHHGTKQVRELPQGDDAGL